MQTKSRYPRRKNSAKSRERPPAAGNCRHVIPARRKTPTPVS